MSFDTNTVEMSTSHMFDAQTLEVCEAQAVEVQPNNLELATIENVGMQVTEQAPSISHNAANDSIFSECLGRACDTIEKSLSNAGVSNSQDGLKVAPEVPEQNIGMDIDAANDANYHNNLAMAAPTPGMGT